MSNTELKKACNLESENKPFHRLLIYVKKKIGPDVDLLETPARTLAQNETLPFRTALCLRIFRKILTS